MFNRHHSGLLSFLCGNVEFFYYFQDLFLELFLLRLIILLSSYCMLLLNIFICKFPMQKKDRLLPNISQLFVRKQSYTSHKNKIGSIRNQNAIDAIRKSLKSVITRRTSLSASKISSSNKPNISSLPPTIQENPNLGNDIAWMSPRRRQQHLHELRENERIYQRLCSPKSDLNPTKLSKEYDKFAKIKERLLKYSVNPESKKAMLKSEKALLYVDIFPRSHHRIATSKQKHQRDEQRRRSFDGSVMQGRKQSNFSAFVKKTYQIKQEGVESVRMKMKQKPKSTINYSKMEKSLNKYCESRKKSKHQIRMQTEMPKSKKLDALSHSINYRYFVPTSPQQY